ncbi:MAG: hypothetical protein LBM05_01905 [Endomicrobium sp.]|nr:hypothetical protein [Endomicrobium sp.]
MLNIDSYFREWGDYLKANKNKLIKYIQSNKPQILLILVLIFAMIFSFFRYTSFSRYAKRVNSANNQVVVAKFAPIDAVNTPAEWSDAANKTDTTLTTWNGSSFNTSKSYGLKLTNNGHVNVSAKIVFDDAGDLTEPTVSPSNPVTVGIGETKVVTVTVPADYVDENYNQVKFHVEYTQVD